MDRYKYEAINSSKFINRFWSKVDKTSNSNGCWIWIGALGRGYGQTSIKGKMLYAHRCSWMLSNKQDWPIPLEARHLCNNRLCVNPLHILPGTCFENTQDKIDAGSQSRGNKHPSTKISEEEGIRLYNEFQALPQRGYRRKYTLAQAQRLGVSCSLIDKICRGVLRQYLR